VNPSNNKYSSASKGPPMVRSRKYYAIQVGRQQGIYIIWVDCKAQVDGFKGAIYKGF
jgi:viroplasmin and RNaseH domain-containing protein